MAVADPARLAPRRVLHAALGRPAALPGEPADLDYLDPGLSRELRPVDVIPDGPPGTAWYVVRQADPPRTLVLHSVTHVPAAWQREIGAAIDWTWCFQLTPGPGGSTRLHLRARCRTAPLLLTAAYLAAIPPADLIMAMGMLHGLRKRVQRQREDTVHARREAEMRDTATGRRPVRGFPPDENEAAGADARGAGGMAGGAGRLAYGLSAALAAVTAGAMAGTSHAGLLRGLAAMNGSARGTALAMLLAGVPLFWLPLLDALGRPPLAVLWPQLAVVASGGPADELGGPGPARLDRGAVVRAAALLLPPAGDRCPGPGRDRAGPARACPGTGGRVTTWPFPPDRPARPAVTVDSGSDVPADNGRGARAEAE